MICHISLQITCYGVEFTSLIPMLGVRPVGIQLKEGTEILGGGEFVPESRKAVVLVFDIVVRRGNLVNHILHNAAGVLFEHPVLVCVVEFLDLTVRHHDGGILNK